MSQAKGSSNYKWVIVTVSSLAMFFSTFGQFQLPPFAPQIIPALGIDPSGFSLLMTASMGSSIFVSIIAGTLCDRFGLRRIITVAVVVAALALILRPFFSSSYPIMLALMFFSGFAPAFISANMAKLIGRWFEPKQIPLAIGFMLLFASLGMSVGSATAGFFPDMNSAFIGAAVIASVFTILFIVFFREKPAGFVIPPPQPTLRYLKQSVKVSGVWIVGICMFFVMGGTMITNTFLSSALQVDRGMDIATSGMIAGLAPIGALVANLTAPLIADRIGYYRITLLGIGILGFVTTGFGWLAGGFFLYISVFLIGYFFSAMMPLYLAFPAFLKGIGREYAGSAGGIIATIQLLGSVTIPTFIIAPIAGENYFLMFILGGVCFLLMGLISLTLPEIGPKGKDRLNESELPKEISS
jgi:NNP family nitrate/nitrite transporter-like MFS transporter